MTYEMLQHQFHIQLNAQQTTAVQHTEGPVLLLAVPGSGKTTVLVTRLGYMRLCCGVSATQILTVTYTVAAARDMKGRFQALFGDTLSQNMEFRTINSLCAAIVRYYVEHKGRSPFQLSDSEGYLNGVIREILTKTGAIYPTELQIKEARTHITYCKNMLLKEEEIHLYYVDGMDFPTVYFEYRDYMRRSRLMDFDDQLVFAYRILLKHRDILAYFQRRYRYICVDEAQDTSKVQHKILGLLAAAHHNLFMVGDEDQSIYGFRAAWPQALLEFEHTYSGAIVLLMETNYRSTRSIVAGADSFIQRNQSRHPKQMRTDHPEGEPIHKIVLEDYSQQYLYLKTVAQDCAISTAVLFRNSDSALPLIDLLDREHIAYACRQRESFFFVSPIVRDVTEMLVFAHDTSNQDSFLRFYYKLDWKIKRTQLSDLLRHQRRGESVFACLLRCGHWEQGDICKITTLRMKFKKIPELSSFSAIQQLVQWMGYGDYLKERHVEPFRLDTLRSLANQTENLLDFLSRLHTLRTLVAHGINPVGCNFTISTIHSSKGLEYDRVLLIDVMDGVFPRNPVAEEGDTDAIAELEEDRRTFYVGITRAKYQLDLLICKKKFGEEWGVHSTFIAQLLGESDRCEPPQQQALPELNQNVPTKPKIPNWKKDYLPGVQVIHKTFGRGILLYCISGIATINFYAHDIKKLDLCLCLTQDLIHLTRP